MCDESVLPGLEASVPPGWNSHRQPGPAKGFVSVENITVKKLAFHTESNSCRRVSLVRRDEEKKKKVIKQLRTMDHSVRGSMKNAANCANYGELQGSRNRYMSNAYGAFSIYVGGTSV